MVIIITIFLCCGSCLVCNQHIFIYSICMHWQAESSAREIFLLRFYSATHETTFGYFRISLHTKKPTKLALLSQLSLQSPTNNLSGNQTAFYSKKNDSCNAIYCCHQPVTNLLHMRVWALKSESVLFVLVDEYRASWNQCYISSNNNLTSSSDSVPKSVFLFQFLFQF